MKGLIVYGNNKIELRRDVPIPEPDDYQCLTKTIACALCNGTDIKLLEEKLRGFSEYPAVLGHESVGEVIRVGKKVKNYKPGDRVLRTNLRGTEKLNSLWGGFAEYGLADDYRARVEDGVAADEGLCTQQVIPGTIDPVDATMIITLKEISSALDRVGMKPGMNVVVVGCGPVGLAMVSNAGLLGASNIIMGGHHPSRLDMALSMGAKEAVNTKKGNLEEAVSRLMPEGADLFVDCVGSTAVIDQGLKVTRETGKIVLYGIGMHTGDIIDWDHSPYNFNIQSVQWPIALKEMAVHDRVVSAVVEGKINLRDFVSHRIPIEDFEEGIRLVKSREGMKVALTF